MVFLCLLQSFFALCVFGSNLIDHFLKHLVSSNDSFTLHMFFYVSQIVIFSASQQLHQFFLDNFHTAHLLLRYLGSWVSGNMERPDWSLGRSHNRSPFLHFSTFLVSANLFKILDDFFTAVTHLNHLLSCLQLFFHTVCGPDSNLVFGGYSILVCLSDEMRRCVPRGERRT